MTLNTIDDIEADVRRSFYADALLLLIRAGEIIKGEGQSAMDALDLSMEDMSAARTRADKPRRPVAPLPAHERADTPAPEAPIARSAPPAPSAPTVQTYHPHASRKRAVREDGFLRCPRHDNGEGAWLEPDAFSLRTDHQTPESDGHRRSWCKQCTAAYQAERYLSVRAAHGGNVRLTYLHDPTDPAVSCTICHQPILPDQAVAILAQPMHEKCLT